MRHSLLWPLAVAFVLLCLGAEAVPRPAPRFIWVRETREINLWTFRAEGYFKRGDYKEAGGYLKKIYKQSKKSQNRGTAAYALAVALEHREKYVKAAEYYRRALNQYANFLPFQDLITAEYQLAVNQFDGKRYFFGLFSWMPEAIKIYEHILKQAPFSAQAPLSQYRLAQIELKEPDKWPTAVRRLRAFLTRYPGHRLEIRVRLQLSEVFLIMAKKAEGDFELLQRARSLLTPLRLNPDAKVAARADRLLVEADQIEAALLLRLGRFYQRDLSYRPQESRRYLQQLLEKYPASPLCSQARLLVIGLPEKPESGVADDEPEEGA